MVPIVFGIEVSLVLIAVFAGIAIWTNRRHAKQLKEYEPRLVPWGTVSIVLWGACILVLFQLVAQLPTYF